MSSSNARYIQIELYDAPDDGGLWGQAIALVSEQEYRRHIPYAANVVHLRIEKAERRYPIAFPRFSSREHVMEWVRGFEREYLRRDRRRLARRMVK